MMTFFMAMLLAGCRTTREAAREEQASQTSETSLMSEDHSSSLDRFFSALSVNADSIVVWYADPSFPWEVESRVVSGLSPETATPMKNDSAKELAGAGRRPHRPLPKSRSQACSLTSQHQASTPLLTRKPIRSRSAHLQVSSSPSVSSKRHEHPHC